MSCEITSKVTTPVGFTGDSTPVDQNEPDSVNLDVHTDELLLLSGIGNGTSVSTTWPGLDPDKVITERDPGETTLRWLNRHNSRCLDRSLTDPIDCP